MSIQNKNKRSFIITLLFVLTGFFSSAKNPEADKVIGMWISPEKDCIVNCYKVNDKYYGKVVWFKRYHDESTPDDPNGVNEDTWMNTVVMKDFIFDEDEWNDGQIYDLKSGKKYSAYITLVNENQLHVTGYILFRFLCKSTDFTRYNNHALPPFN